MGPDEGPERSRRVTGVLELRACLGRIGCRLEPRGRAIHDRPQDVLLRGDVGVQAGAANVERLGDVADARAGITALAKQVAGDVLDGPSTRDFGVGELDQDGLLTNDR
jgi:hypothetical protein